MIYLDRTRQNDIIVENFTALEFLCKCGKCTNNHLDKTLLTALHIARKIYGKPMIITSGFRCHKHNMEIGGNPNSWHLYGRAIDIYIEPENFELVKILEQCFEYTELNAFKGYCHCSMKSFLMEDK